MKKYRTAEGLIARKIGGEQVLVPVGKMTQKFNGMITQNETAAFLWNALKTPKTIEELVNEVMQEFEVGEQLARRDVSGYVLGGVKIGTIVEVE